MQLFRTVGTIKPKSDADGLTYSPQRDLAYNFQPLLTEVFRSLTSENWSPGVRLVLSETGLSDAELDAKLGDAVLKFATGLRGFLRDPEINTPEKAMASSGFDELDPRIQMVLYGGIGAAMTSGFFYCAKDNTMQGEPTATHLDWVGMLSAAQRASARLLKSDPAPVEGVTDIVSSTEYIRNQAVEFERILLQKTNLSNNLQAKLIQASKEVMEQKQVLDACQQFLPYVQKLVSNPTFWRKVYQGLCLFLTAIRCK